MSAEQTPNTEIDNEIVETAEVDSVQSEADTLNARIAELEEQVKAAKDTAARANAENYNAQRRMEQETEKAKKYALQKFAKELLEVVDNLERAIDSGEKAGSDEAALEGIRLTHKSLLGVLEKNGVSAVGEVGDAFNPDIHEAVGMLPDVEKDTIGQVLQKGYVLNDRTLRPAIVMVGG